MRPNATHRERSFSIFLLISFAASLIGCGGGYIDEEENFRTLNATNRDLESENGNGQTIDPGKVGSNVNIVWKLWPCNETDSVSSGVDEELLFTDKGPHKFIMKDDTEFKLSLAGSFCKTEEFGRAIVFVIDVSESMRNAMNVGSDPVIGQSCKRLDAIRGVVDSFSASDKVKFALVTFDAGLKQHSNGFWDADQFKTLYAKVNIICEVGTTTNYKAGLDKAEEFLNELTEAYSKEVYFVSDGLANSQAQWGTETANRIKAKGMIGTMMIGANDGILRNNICSRTLDGNPLHITISTAANLPQQLLTLTNSEIVGGRVSYASIGRPSVGAQIQVEPNTDENFKIYDIEASKKNYPEGLKVTYRFWDTRSALYEKVGTILWVDEPVVTQQKSAF